MGWVKVKRLDAPTLVCDFDGTLALEDLGDALCARFADPSWREHEAAWHEGRLSLPEAQRRMWATVRADAETLREAAMELGALRPGADALFEAARRGDIELVIASGGFDLYVEPLLGGRRALVSALYCNHLEPSSDGAVPHFPHAELAKGPYAICKAEVVRRHRAAHFCGDGSSDRSVTDTEVTIHAVRGSLLETWCNERGHACVPFDDFQQVLARIP